jgi:hypothetical protein
MRWIAGYGDLADPHGDENWPLVTRVAVMLFDQFTEPVPTDDAPTEDPSQRRGARRIHKRVTEELSGTGRTERASSGLPGWLGSPHSNRSPTPARTARGHEPPGAVSNCP